MAIVLVFSMRGRLFRRRALALPYACHIQLFRGLDNEAKPRLAYGLSLFIREGVALREQIVGLNLDEW
jgi:hypothetical protein